MKRCSGEYAITISILRSDFRLNVMLLTFFVIAFFCGLIISSVILWAVTLRFGLRRIHVENVTWRQIICATAAVFAINLLLKLTLGGISPRSDSESQLVNLAWLAAAFVLPNLIISKLFRIPFATAVKAWLPTLLTSFGLFVFAVLVMKPFLFEVYVSPTNAMAPTLRGHHACGTCSECGAATVCVPTDAPTYEGPSAPVICENFSCHTGFSAG